MRPDRIIRMIRKQGGRALIGLVGVQSNQFPRAVDLARPFLAAGLPVCIGGFHVSGCIAMLPELPPDIREAQALGISFFAGEAEERPPRRGPARRLERRAQAALQLHGQSAVADRASRRRSCRASTCGAPPARSRASISAAAAPTSARSAPSSTCRAARAASARPTIWNASCARTHAQGIKRFFITDDNFARNRDWEVLFDRLIELRRRRIPQARLHHPGRHALPQDSEFHREGGAGRRPPRLHRA